MAARAEKPCPYSPSPKKQREKGQLWIHAAAWAVAAVLSLACGMVCWRGMSFLLRGIDQAIQLLPGKDPVQESIAMDLTAPVITGVHDFTVCVGEAVAYMSGISASDESDPNPALTVDKSTVDLSRPGQYRIVYTAADASGNTTRAEATVTVLEAQAGGVSPDAVYAAADSKLKEILREDATIREQVHDIYAWARLSLSYGGHSDRTDWLQTAYGMLTEGKGDCYGYWAVTKLLFERLEIPNIDVRKVKNSPEDTDHFWSLVSLDGGDTWYHFDSTPRYGEGDDFCLVTDSFLDAYSDSHKGSHNRDKEQYPETP